MDTDRTKQLEKALENGNAGSLLVWGGVGLLTLLLLNRKGSGKAAADKAAALADEKEKVYETYREGERLWSDWKAEKKNISGEQKRLARAAQEINKAVWGEGISG